MVLLSTPTSLSELLHKLGSAHTDTSQVGLEIQHSQWPEQRFESLLERLGRRRLVLARFEFGLN